MPTKLENLTTKLQSALDAANALPDAITLDELTNPGSAATMLAGTEMLDADGKKVTGTIESKDSSDLTASGATVNVPAGYYAEDASTKVATMSLPQPVIRVSDTGAVTASVEATTSGFVFAGTSSIKQTKLDTQEATTITPTKSTQTAVAKNVYTTGAVTVAPIPAQYITTTDATAASDDIVTGETAYVNGSKVTGTNPYVKTTTDAQVSEIGELVAELSAAIEGKSVSGGGASGGTIETCTVTLEDAWNYGGYTYAYTGINSDGKIEAKHVVTGKSATVITCVCGSGLYYILDTAESNAYITPTTISSQQVLSTSGSVGGSYEALWCVPLSVANGDTVSVYIGRLPSGGGSN